MKLYLPRYSSQQNDTLGLLFIDRRWAVHTLEDEAREVKVPGETCIPAGTYALALRKEGGMHQKYLERFPDIHRGMLWLQDVPNFEYVYFHCGTREKDTAGCILVADGSQQNLTADGLLTGSSTAYRRIYPRISEAIQREEVTVKVEDFYKIVKEAA